MIKVPGHFKFFAILISSLRFFSDTFSKFFASPTVLFWSDGTFQQ